ncbi:hypothetical protein RJ641_033794 [Dillenia turbinata]|uniref:Uncharacterized protein n=1 Tax=Dillenia turbinata TaxID=194707 RepID=A0AAN8ZDM1_9MAGN
MDAHNIFSSFHAQLPFLWQDYYFRKCFTRSSQYSVSCMLLVELCVRVIFLSSGETMSGLSCSILLLSKCKMLCFASRSLPLLKDR